MKQVAQRARDGSVSVLEVPEPAVRPGWVLVENRCSLISAGTERNTIETGNKNLLQKARARPDLARKVIDQARVQGVRTTLTTVRDRLDAQAPIGYSCSGVVRALGTGVEGFAPGDRVACGGAGWANHAEIVVVPKNLVVKIPDGIDFEAAAYATVGSIALHGVRQAEVTLGERIGVIGLGLVGQLAVQTLLAAGCLPIAIDVDERAVKHAHDSGALAYRRDLDGLEPAVLQATHGLGLDAVLVCAATRSADPVKLAARLSRDRGRVVIVGDVPIEGDRAVFYEKELELRLSRSYGPGRYDRNYEEHGRDLPPAYVRWTEQRNLEAFLGLVAAGKIDPSRLTTHRFAVEQAAQAYAVLTAQNAEVRPFGILLEYEYEERKTEQAASPPPVRRKAGTVRVGLVGAGNFARATLLPALRDAGAEFAAVASERGLTAADVANRFGFERAAGSANEIIEDESIDAVVVATRHASHAELAATALRAGKAVLVEKPLALSEAQLGEVEQALGSGALLMVGFNRRHAPLTARLREAFASVAAPTLLVRVNAGPLPEDHWLHDPEDGGGRLVGEGCHFVDLLCHFAGFRVVTAFAAATPIPGRPIECSDEFVATLRFESGAIGALVYSGSGGSRLPKERIEVFGGGISAVIDDFRRFELFRDGKQREQKGAQDKGHRAEVALFLAAVKGEADPPPVETYLHSSRVTLALLKSLRTGSAVELR